MKDKIIEFFRNVFNWIKLHKKAFIAICVVVFLLVVITACSTIGEADNVSFGLVNTAVESHYGTDSV